MLEQRSPNSKLQISAETDEVKWKFNLFNFHFLRFKCLEESCRNFLYLQQICCHQFSACKLTSHLDNVSR